MRGMVASAVFTAAVSVVLAASSAARAGDPKYSASANIVPHLVIQSDEPEGDSLLNAVCIQADMVDLRLGAQFDVGKGDGKPVSLALKTGAASAKASGVSLVSINAPMTGASELAARLPTTDPLFAVLTSGATVRVSGSIQNPETVTLGPGATKALKKFLSDCATLH